MTTFEALAEVQDELDAIVIDVLGSVLDEEAAPGSVATGDVDEAVEAIRRLKAIAVERRYRVIPGHDPDVWPAFTAELGCAGPTTPGRFLAAAPAEVPA